LVKACIRGDRVDVSIVRMADMQEMAHVRTSILPHGSGISRTRHYSACMMGDQLEEIDIRPEGVVSFDYPSRAHPIVRKAPCELLSPA
jgi:hypothetical protein